ncbi:MAG TPA: flagellar export chaperone FliS [Clostridiaceae bacterium]|mgnify:CR=1 FL=1|jgi:flagellar protein FliS|nr:flagellar export chaperone FliS [Clostridiaceae bacterium]HBF77390.1 flagellar export chaperone FliS [Clostridiaceae bacterium]HBG39531.1 flagellar export chaperone FliS [Clostridiaceae bacterium]HBN27677.1 flagellar export chaperone FliS [Clostridiaceae bacterium]HBX49029.1 flagellar export chaperone FliS [Clostridiaceae bacterium]
MYAATNAINAYQQNGVNTASKEKLLLMLYDGLVKFIKQGIAGLDEKDYSKSNTNFIKAENIINEFMSTLNMEVGGEIPKSLMALYDYMNRRLVEANIKKDKNIAEEVLGFAEELKQTFEEAYKIAKKN